MVFQCTVFAHVASVWNLFIAFVASFLNLFMFLFLAEEVFIRPIDRTDFVRLLFYT